MKRLFLSIFLVLLFAGIVSANTLVSDTVEGSQIKTYWTATTGAWQAISLPAALKNSRHVYLQVHNGTSGGYAHSAVEFEVSSESDGTGWIWVNDVEISIGVPGSGVICYVRAAVGQYVAVMILR